MAKTYPTKWFNEKMQGAAQTGETTNGAMISILKSCLVDGFGFLDSSTLVWDDDLKLAKASFNSGHSYLADSIITCSGATPEDYNGEHRVVKVTANDVYFELNTEPSSNATGSINFKVSPLGWKVEFSNDTNDKIIFSTASDIGNVYLMVDNTDYDGWIGPSQTGACLMKVAMIENPVDIDSYEVIELGYWPCTGRYSDQQWDIVGDSKFFFLLPQYAAENKASCFYAGYIDSIRVGDRYHFIMNKLEAIDTTDSINADWESTGSGEKYYVSSIKNNDFTNNLIARRYHQLKGSATWMKTGLGNHNSDLMTAPNLADNGFYFVSDPSMIFEDGGVLRGYLPIMISPLSDYKDYFRENLSDLPLFEGKIFRMLKSTYSQQADLEESLIGFDISSVEV